MKIITNAKIQIIKSHELKIGDRILYQNILCIVKEIDVTGKVNLFNESDPEMTFEDKRFSFWYKIIESDNHFVCHRCFNNEVFFEDFCEGCKKEMDEEKDIDYGY